MKNIVRRRSLVVDPGIAELLDKKQNSTSATEADVRMLLKRYSTKDCLIAFSRFSREIFYNTDFPGSKNVCLFIDEQSGAVVTQPALAYLSCLAILSGGNDYKSLFQKAESKDNLLGVCQIYNNCLPATISGEEIHKYGPALFLLRMNDEQLSYQISWDDAFARTFVIYFEVVQEVFAEGLSALNDVHLKETGLNLEDFLWIAFGFFALNLKYLTFRPSQLYEADVQGLKHVFTKTKVEAFIRLISLSYSGFRDYDLQMNSHLSDLSTKLRFNPLVVYPIVSLQVPEDGRQYIIPNNIAYLRRTTEGLFWWFDTEFERNAALDRNHFRSYFGDIFQEYVGRVLKAIYGESLVMSEFSYGSRKERKAFSDWWVIKNNKIYLFEVKAHQVNLQNRKVTDVEKYRSEEVTKVAKAICQLFKVVNDIRRGKIEDSRISPAMDIVPVVVFFDVPFVAESGIFGEWLKEELLKLENSSSELKGLSEFKAYPINIDELEPYESISDVIDLEGVFLRNDEEGTKSNISSVMSSIAREQNRRFESGFLNAAYRRFFEGKNIC